MVYKIIAVTIAVVVAMMVLVPIVTSAVDNEIAVTEIGSNEGGVQLGYDTSNIALTYDDGTTWNFDEAHADVTTIVTSAVVIELSSNNVTLNGETVNPATDADTIIIQGSTVTTYADGTPTVYNLDAISGSYCVLTDAAPTKTYGMWDTVSSVIINKNTNLIVIDSGAPELEQYTGETQTGTAVITATASETYEGAYEVSAVGTSGTLVAMLDYQYNNTVPIDDNMKTILTIVPYLVVIGIILMASTLLLRRRD